MPHSTATLERDPPIAAEPLPAADPGAAPATSRVQLFDLACAAVALLAIWIRLNAGPAIYDDAYITFRYAANAAAGHGLVYNPGQHVLGASCPLWILLLTLAALCHIAPPVAGYGIAMAADAVTVALLMWLGRRFVSIYAGVLAGLIFAVAPKAVLPGTSGMETSLYSCLIFATGVCIASRRWNAAGLVAGLVAILRPEGLIVVVAMGIVGYRSWPRRTWLFAAAPLVAWCAFSGVYYHTLIPLSVIAKAGMFAPLPRGADFWLLLRYVTHMSDFIPDAANLRTLGLPHMLLMALGAWAARKEAAGRYLIAWACLYVATFALLNRYMFGWYFAPLFAPAVLLQACGFGWILQRVDAVLTRYTISVQERSSPPRFVVKPQIALVVTALACWSIYSTLLPAAQTMSNDWSAAWHLREGVYQQSARWVQAHSTPGTPVELGEIGAFGYVYRGPIRDLYGLVSPDIAAYWRGNPPWIATDRRILAAIHPRYFVAFADLGMPIMADAATSRRFRLVHTLPVTGGMHGNCLIFAGL